jgi:threonylcarbamoyladenosine tRNA methylthiotransferase MtaB
LVASFYVQNFGCRATQADGAAIERQFHERGLARADTAQDADIVVLNTCTVTASADQDARSTIRRIHRENPDCKIVVTGCYAQRAPEEIAALPGVSRVIGNSHKHDLAEIVSGKSGFVPMSRLLANDQRRTATDGVFVSNIFAHTELLAAPVFDAGRERTRPNLKVQDGCDNRCSFCVIPSVRGQSRSLPLVKILSEVEALVASGYREIVISGINLGRWGKDLASSSQRSALGQGGPGADFRERPTTSGQRPRFEDLIRAILAETFLEKLRISSVEPMDWSDDLIRIMADSSRIAKHAHVPMQSGSDRVLRRMHRKYRPWHYREKIEKIRAAMPAAAIGADVMVGFPGETDTEFDETRRLIDELPLTYLHVFTYSPRPGTPAALMPNQVSVNVTRERHQVLRQLAAEKKLAFMRALVGRRVQAITLNRMQNRPSGDFTEALTDNFLKMLVPGRHPANQWVQAYPEQIADEMLVGRANG